VEKDPVKNDRRRSRRKRQLGEDAACVLCGYQRSSSGLLKVDRCFLEEHHLLGWVTDDALTTWLCRNCHAEVTEDQRIHDVDFDPPTGRSAQEEVGGDLRALGPLLAKIAQRLTDDGYRLDPDSCLTEQGSPEHEQLREDRTARIRGADGSR
jgi:hypothetical protein